MPQSTDGLIILPKNTLFYFFLFFLIFLSRNLYMTDWSSSRVILRYLSKRHYGVPMSRLSHGDDKLITDIFYSFKRVE